MSLAVSAPELRLSLNIIACHADLGKGGGEYALGRFPLQFGLGKKGTIGALMMRVGFWAQYTIIVLRNPRIVLVIIQAPTVLNLAPLQNMSISAAS